MVQQSENPTRNQPKTREQQFELTVAGANTDAERVR